MKLISKIKTFTRTKNLLNFDRYSVYDCDSALILIKLIIQIKL